MAELPGQQERAAALAAGAVASPDPDVESGGRAVSPSLATPPAIDVHPEGDGAKAPALPVGPLEGGRQL